MSFKKITTISALAVILCMVGCQGNLPQQVSQSVNSSVVATTTPVNEDVATSDWKMYRNEDHGFEMRYPADFKLEQGDKGVINVYDRDWEQMEDDFKRDYKAPVIWVEFVDIEPNLGLEAQALKILKLYDYSEVDGALGLKTGIWEYGYRNLSEVRVFYVVRGEEASYYEYFIPSLKSSNKMALVYVAFSVEKNVMDFMMQSIKF